MFVSKGDNVILIETDQPQLRNYIGTQWKVEAVMLSYHPASAIISSGNLQASIFIRYLEVIPPADSPFEYKDLIKIKEPYEKVNAYTCKKELLGKIGKIRGYDSRNTFYFIHCNTGECGWFPIQSLVPLSYKGERFYYPLEKIRFKDKVCIINKIKQSIFKYGQLLLIDGEWIHSTDVEPIFNKNSH